MATIPILEAVMPAIHTGAEQRTFGGRAREAVHLLDFIPEVEHAAILARTSTYDALAAFNAAMDSVGQFTAEGPTIILPLGRVRLNGPIHIKKVCHIRGQGGGYQADTAASSTLQFAADQHGIIVHSVNTYALTSTTTTWSSGSTYTVGSVKRSTSTTIAIYQVAVQGPGTSTVRPVHTGGTVSGSDGYSWTYLATGRGGVGTILSQFELESLGGTTGHGVWMRARVVCYDIYMTGWPQDGYHIHADSGAGGEFEGNANNWRVYNGRVINSGRNGMYIDGSDANAGMAIGVDCSSNAGWGFRDESFLGNTFIACHTNDNLGETELFRQYDGGQWACIDDTLGLTTTPGTDAGVWYARSTISSVLWASGTPYIVSSNTVYAPTTHRVYSCTVAGGGNSTNEPVHASGATAYGDGYTWSANSTPLWFNGDTTIIEGGAYKMHGSNLTSLLLGCYAEGAQAAYISARSAAIFGGFGRSDATVGGALLTPDRGWNRLITHGRDSVGDDYSMYIGDAADQDFLWQFDHETLTSGRLRLTLIPSEGTLEFREGNVTGERSWLQTLDATTLTFGRTSVRPFAFYVDRLFVGTSPTAGRQIDSGTAAPTSGDRADGDWRFNSAPLHAEPIGWRCVLTGTPGTWEPIENRTSYQTVSSDAAFSLTPLTTPYATRHTGVLNADRQVTLSTTGATAGMGFKITRTGAGAFNLNIGTGPLKALITNTWCEVIYDGSAWYLAAYGAL